MHEQPPAGTPRLTGMQLTRIDFAQRDLEQARAEDLAALEPAALILRIQRLRSRLGDMLNLVTEVCDTTPPSQPDE